MYSISVTIGANQNLACILLWWL